MSLPNVSADLIWELVRNNNAFLVKRKTGGGAQFSRDPLNLTNKHTRTHAGFVNDKAIGVVGNEKGLQIVSKKSGSGNKPASSYTTSDHASHKPARANYKAAANRAAKNGYRSDLRQAAVARVSAIRRSQRAPKPEPERKLRGKKAQKAE